MTQVRVRATKVAVEIRNRRSQQHNQVQQQLKRLCPDIGRKWLCKDHFRALRGTLDRQIVVLLALQRNPTKSTKGWTSGRVQRYEIDEAFGLCSKELRCLVQVAEERRLRVLFRYSK